MPPKPPSAPERDPIVVVYMFDNEDRVEHYKLQSPRKIKGKVQTGLFERKANRVLVGYKGEGYACAAYRGNKLAYARIKLPEDHNLNLYLSFAGDSNAPENDSISQRRP
jgi:hypothetical protein